MQTFSKRSQFSMYSNNANSLIFNNCFTSFLQLKVWKVPPKKKKIKVILKQSSRVCNQKNCNSTLILLSQFWICFFFQLQIPKKRKVWIDPLLWFFFLVFQGNWLWMKIMIQIYLADIFPFKIWQNDFFFFFLFMQNFWILQSFLKRV